jgi:alkylation response protein AidB-like acyl-CoA dehydrogenase
MELSALTTAGGRFVEIAEHHTDAFRARATDHDETGTFPTENFAELRSSGAVAAFVPDELGGLGLDSIHDWAVGLERLARGDASTAIALNMHLAISRTMAMGWRDAVARGDEASATRSEGMLRAIAAGDLIVCATATEPGTDFLRPLTTATPTPEGFTIDGRKIFVTLSPVANLLAMNVRVAAAEGDQIGFAFVPIDTPGIEPQGDWNALGMRASGSQSVVIRGCKVAAGSIQLAGPWGRWSAGLLMGRTLGNLTLVGAFLGIAERARELAVHAARTQTKPKFDGAIGQAAGVQHLLGEIDIDLAAARGVLGTTAAELDAVIEAHAADPIPLQLAHECMRDYQCAKWTVNQNAIQIVSRAMDVCGGGAFMSGHELSRLYRDVRAGPFMQPFSPTEAREYIGRIAVGANPDG